jgi:SAM-dependent methyltransferase
VSASLFGRLHESRVKSRRARVLSRHLSELLETGESRILDVGCGNGDIGKQLGEALPELSIEGVEVQVPSSAKIPVGRFDGRHLPQASASFDVVLLVDVLHHAEDPSALLAECARVARKAVLVKDHLLSGWLAGPTLRFMDWAGNARYGVPLRFDFWDQPAWNRAIAAAALEPRTVRRRLGLYPWPASLVFERRLHFTARLEKRRSGV